MVTLSLQWTKLTDSSGLLYLLLPLLRLPRPPRVFTEPASHPRLRPNTTYQTGLAIPSLKRPPPSLPVTLSPTRLLPAELLALAEMALVFHYGVVSLHAPQGKLCEGRSLVIFVLHRIPVVRGSAHGCFTNIS